MAAEKDGPQSGTKAVGFDVLPPNGAIGDFRGGRIQKDNFRIEAMPTIFGPVDAPTIAESRGQAGHQDVPVIAGAVLLRVERNLRQDSGAFQRIKNEPHGGAMPA